MKKDSCQEKLQNGPEILKMLCGLTHINLEAFFVAFFLFKRIFYDVTHDTFQRFINLTSLAYRLTIIAKSEILYILKLLARKILNPMKIDQKT